MTDETQDARVEREEERSMMFVCGGCGTGNPLHGKPSEFEGRIFSCEGCGENTLLKNHRPEPPSEVTDS